MLRTWRQIRRLREELRAPSAPVELITRPPNIQRRAVFRRKLARLARLEQRFEDDFVAGIEKARRK